MRRACTPYPVNTAALVAAEAAIRDKRFARNYTRKFCRAARCWKKDLCVWARGFIRAPRISCLRISVRQRIAWCALWNGRAFWCASGRIFRERLCAHQRRHASRYAPRAARDGRDPVKLAPKLVIFDVDGVLVDVRGSFHRSIIDTIHFFTGRRVTYAEIHEWKNRSGYNDDWRLTTDWIASLGEAVPYAVVKKRFQKFYWGTKRAPGNVSRENAGSSRTRGWSDGRGAPSLRCLPAARAGSCSHTLERHGSAGIFRRAVTMDDVTKGKPDPEGLRLLLNGTSPREALYLGDNIDDALAAKRARVPFLGFFRTAARRIGFRAAKLRELGALAILHSVRDLEKLWR